VWILFSGKESQDWIWVGVQLTVPNQHNPLRHALPKDLSPPRVERFERCVEVARV